MPSESDTCPHCGEVNEDLWDLEWNDADHDAETWCDNCEKPILVTRHHEVTYTISVRVDAEPGEGGGE